MIPFNASIFCIRPSASIREAIAAIDRSCKGIMLVTDEAGILQGTITDGDIRRAMLVGENLDAPVTILLKRKKTSRYSKPVTAPIGTDPAELLCIMHEKIVHQIPLLDGEGRVAGLITMDDLLPDQILPLQTVVMAGGFGQRLRPLTEGMPKPMLKVGDRPILQRMIEQLKSVGIRRVNLTTHYRGDLIKEHFGDGKKFGMDICYVNEDQPLGTAGVLGLITPSHEPLLVINGDIMTEVNFGALLHFHKEHKADMTVAVRAYEMSIPYGVVESDGVEITHISEKPMIRHFINAGIYLINPDICQSLPKGEAFDMPDLITKLVLEKRRVISFPIREYWLDIGRIEDYQKAQDDEAKRKI